MSEEIMLKIDNVSKKYKLGQIGGTTLRDELQRLKAKRKGLEDPTKVIGTRDVNIGEEFYALNNISFEVKKGERVGIIGHNGAGKSTLLKLISRVTAPTEGTISMNGRVASMLEVGTGFHQELTGRENIYMNGAILGMSKKEIDSKIEDIIEFSECRQFIDTPVKRYSSGMYVKLAFSVAAHLDSEILIMDEVLAVGDMAFQKKCLDKMNDVSRQDGRTILYVSHNMNTIRQLCDRAIVLEHGKVIFDGDVEEGISLYSKSSNCSSCHMNLKTLKRNKWANIDGIIMDKLDILDRDVPIYKNGERLNAQLTIIGKKLINNVQIRIELLDRNDNPISSHVTKNGFNIEKKGKVFIDLCIDISKIAPGQYKMGVMFFIPSNISGYVDLDILHDVFYFEIKPTKIFNHGIPWKKQWWGSYYDEIKAQIRYEK